MEIMMNSRSGYGYGDVLDNKTNYRRPLQSERDNLDFCEFSMTSHNRIFFIDSYWVVAVEFRLLFIVICFIFARI